ncbi:hypothetical protein AGDE_06831 [Angomonas deanei]|nr:hypothetical protein AGDE_06831 [Angomonas deanei]|eukprot:EPY36611.1 hypothetical protein AGDE_06831 [Angomonas deanei]
MLHQPFFLLPSIFSFFTFFSLVSFLSPVSHASPLDVVEMCDDKAKFIAGHPNSALAARYFYDIECDSSDVVLKLIDGAVFYDSWEAYFIFAESNNLPIAEDVLVDAIRSTGLDPLSFPLWKRVIASGLPDEEKRDLLALALSVPIHGSRAILKAYRELESASKNHRPISEGDIISMESVLVQEKWPDRYDILDTEEARLKQKTDFLVLIDYMLSLLKSENSPVSSEIQIKRIDLAFRQMCEQLKNDDSVWLQYACFHANVCDDLDAARDTVELGIQLTNGSVLLSNLRIILSDGDIKSIQEKLGNYTKRNEFILSQQRTAGETLRESNFQKASLDLFRSHGKNAASNGVSDSRVYSQWWKGEALHIKDKKMAEKVLKNGMRCCAPSMTDAILLGSQAVDYHLLHANERESLGYAEGQLELQTHSLNKRRLEASWNYLVNAEVDLGLAFGKAANRRDATFPKPHLVAFLEKYRVGTYAPCSKAELESIQYDVDLKAEYSSAETQTIQGCDIPAREKSICPPKVPLNQHFLNIKPECWKALDTHSQARPSAAPPQESPDTVVGPRKHQGKLGYRMILTPATEARCERELRRRAKRGREDDDEDGEELIGLALVRKTMKSIQFEESQERRYRELSANWVINYLLTKVQDFKVPARR